MSIALTTELQGKNSKHVIAEAKNGDRIGVAGAELRAQTMLANRALCFPSAQPYSITWPTWTFRFQESYPNQPYLLSPRMTATSSE